MLNNFEKNFWDKLDELITIHQIVIERPRGSTHPKFSEYVYPHDYGYVNNTTSTDGAEIDCWVGTKRSSKLDSKRVDGIIATIDMAKGDSEMKLLIDCSEADMGDILKCHNRGLMSGILIERSKPKNI